MGIVPIKLESSATSIVILDNGACQNTCSSIFGRIIIKCNIAPPPHNDFGKGSFYAALSVTWIFVW